MIVGRERHNRLHRSRKRVLGFPPKGSGTAGTPRLEVLSGTDEVRGTPTWVVCGASGRLSFSRVKSFPSCHVLVPAMLFGIDGWPVKLQSMSDLGPWFFPLFC